MSELLYPPKFPLLTEQSAQEQSAAEGDVMAVRFSSLMSGGCVHSP